MKNRDVLIIGAGPAGLATAIQLKRYGIDPTVFERDEAGGLLLNANLVENYPGFPGGISGPKLASLFIKQAQDLDIAVTYEEVTALEYAQGKFQAITSQNMYVSNVAVIATGTKPQHLTDISIPESLLERVFYEVYPLLKVEGKHMVIVGSGDAAFDYGLNLSKRNQVTILNRGELPKCLPLLWERAQKVPAITYQAMTDITQIQHDQNGMKVNCRTPTGGLQLNADYLVGAIGREPQLDCISGILLQNAWELENQGIMYIIGDVKNGIYRQTSIAVGEGVMTAMKIYRRLKEIQ